MRLVMMGTGTFAEPTFRAILASGHDVVGLVTQPNKSIGEERGTTRQTGEGMTVIAQSHGVGVFQPASINSPEGVEIVRSLNADLLVVAAYGQILSKDILGLPRLGGINVHASLLPKYRGAAPVAWAIYHGETQTGVTLIRMTAGLDAGDMLAQEKITIGPEETAGALETRLADLGSKLARDVVDRLAVGPVSGERQDPSQATKAPKLTKAHGAIDWNRAAMQVRDHIRAMQPWPTPYTYLHRGSHEPLRLIVARASVVGPDQPSGTNKPGDFVPHGQGDRLLIATGSGLLEVVELQPAGRKRMSGADFVRGQRLVPGDWFGPVGPEAK
jgi:methionyl-tRNA formyltransferase